MKMFLPILCALSVSTCKVQEPLEKQKADNNKSYEVQYLFEHDGCKVYRFMDLGKYIYFTNCNGEAIATTDSTQTKNTIKKR